MRRCPRVLENSFIFTDKDEREKSISYASNGLKTFGPVVTATDESF